MKTIDGAQFYIRVVYVCLYGILFGKHMRTGRYRCGGVVSHYLRQFTSQQPLAIAGSLIKLSELKIL
jgi:hypothetical protein